MPFEPTTEAGRLLRKVAWERWRCRRPDKTHWLTREDAESRMARMKDMHHDQDPTAAVYRCCDVGWVWGRHESRRPSP